MIMQVHFTILTLCEYKLCNDFVLGFNFVDKKQKSPSFHQSLPEIL